MRAPAWWRDWQAQRFRQAWQERERILADLRANGWPHRVRTFARERGQQVWQAVSQAPGKARQGGRAMAVWVLRLQRDAGLNDKLVRRSALSVGLTERTATPAHAEWVGGYRKVVEHTRPELAAGRQAVEPRGWPHIDPKGPEAGA